LGDLILALPALWSLYWSLEPERFSVAGHPWAIGVLEDVPWVTELLDVNLSPFSTLWWRPSRLDFTHAVVFSNSTEWERSLKASGIGEVWLMPPFPRRRIPLLHHHLEGLRRYGILYKVAFPDLSLRDEERESARTFLKQRGITGPYFVIHPGAGSPQKIWPPERMAEIARWASRWGYFPVVVEGPADGAPCSAFLKALGIPFLHLKHPPLRFLCAIISQGRFFLGNDSGISHLAAASGCPTLVLFGPTDPVLWSPRGVSVRWIWKRAECAPCSGERRRGCRRCKAMEAISVEDVKEGLLALLGREEGA